MRHITDGDLRRMLDDANAVPDGVRRHLDQCQSCASRRANVARDAANAHALFGGPTPEVRPAVAYQALQRRLSEDGPEQRAPTRPFARIVRERLWKPAAAAGAVAALVGALSLTPAGSLAQSFMTIFQPTQLAPVQLTPADLQGLPNLIKYGTVHAPKNVRVHTFTSARAAARAAHLAVRVPGALPSSVPSRVVYNVTAGSTGTFTFSAAKAAREAARHGKTLPAMPAHINGAALQVTIKPAVAATYRSSRTAIPALIIGQSKAPTVSSTGVSVKELEDYVLSLPGISPHLAAQIRGLGSAQNTLPIPIIASVNKAYTQSVTINGNQGLLVGDSTGLGSGVVWEDNGVIYGVAGPLSQSAVLSIAKSLH